MHLFKLLFISIQWWRIADAFVNHRFHSTTTTTTTRLHGDRLNVSLPKPLGLLLEEVEEGKAAGVYVAGFAEAGSALPYRDQIQGATLSTVQGMDVTQMDFETTMDAIINAPDTVDLQFLTAVASSTTTKEDEYPVGTPVIIQFISSEGRLEMKTAVGDNLRKLMLENGVEVYQGMKQKLGNCGGGGTCTFCAVDILESQGWAERSDYEDQRLAKFPGARLACLNSVQGPATIQKTKR